MLSIDCAKTSQLQSQSLCSIDIKTNATYNRVTCFKLKSKKKSLREHLLKNVWQIFWVTDACLVFFQNMDLQVSILDIFQGIRGSLIEVSAMLKKVWQIFLVIDACLEICPT